MSKTKKLISMMMALCMSASLMTACQSKEEPPQEPPVSTEAGEEQGQDTEQDTQQDSGEQNAEQASEDVCKITIQGFCTETEFAIESGDTVYNILKKTQVDMGATKNGDSIFVDGINGKYAGDEGETSGWVYTVNGERPEQSCDKYEVKAGDNIVWEYVTE